MAKANLGYSLCVSFALHLAMLGAFDSRDPFVQVASGVSRGEVSVVLGGRPNIEMVVVEEAAEIGGGLVEQEVVKKVEGEKTAVTGTARSMDEYLPPSRLSQVPFPKDEIAAELYFKGFEGLVGEAEIMVLISSDGEVDDILLLDSTLPLFLVEKAILRFREIKFVPGVQGSMNVRSRVRIRLSPPTEDQLMGNPYSSREKAWRR